MRVVVGFLVLGWVSLGSLVSSAQVSQPVVPLQLQGEARDTQVPPYASLTSPQCDSAGDIYLRYATPGTNSLPAALATIAPDGSTQTISLSSGDDNSGDNHPFLFAAGEDGSLHEILRTRANSDQDALTKIQYASFDTDGSLRSAADFGQEFIPSLLLPLPDGSFFASGVTLKDSGEGGISESPLVGIFNADAQFVRPLRHPGQTKTAIAQSGGDDSDGNDTAFDGGIAKLGDDGNIYVLLPGDHAKVAVVSPSGLIKRELDMQEPFETTVAHDMWISASRILIVYEGEASNPTDAYVYVVYDAQTGEVIRVYRPEFTGTIACFQDGQDLSVLLEQQSSGKVTLGTAELQ